MCGVLIPLFARTQRKQDYDFRSFEILGQPNEIKPTVFVFEQDKLSTYRKVEIIVTQDGFKINIDKQTSCGPSLIYGRPP